MRGLAEYTMLGRRQAIIIVLLCGFLPMLYFISAAVLALVSLRKGMNEGLLMLLWAMLPAAASWALGDPMPLILMPGITLLAQVLRRTQRWQDVLIGAVVLGIIAQFSLLLQPTYVAELEQMLDQALNMQRSQGTDLGMSGQELADALLGYYGAYHALAAVGCMALARWWQAALYNPGGFRKEFHQLRLSPVVAGLALLLIVTGMAGLEPFSSLQPIISVAPLISGLALMHGLAGLKNLAAQWLVLAYLALLFMAPVLVMAGLLDSVLDVRKRVGDTQK